MFEGKYTTMGSRSTLHPRVAKQQLNQHLGEVLAPVSDEIRDSFKIYLPKTNGTLVPFVAVLRVQFPTNLHRLDGFDYSR